MSSGERACAVVEAALREHPEAVLPPKLEATRVAGGWLVRGEGVELRVDGLSFALSGTARVDPLRARARLFALMCFAIAAAWFGARLFELAAWLMAVPLRALGAARLVDSRVTVALTLLGTLWLAVRFTQWVATLRPELLDEPVATVAEGLARWPAPGGVEELLRRSGLMMVPLIVYGLVSAQVAWLRGLRWAAAFALLGLVPIGLVIIESRCVRLIPAGLRPTAPLAGGSWAEFVTTGLLGSRLALGVMLFSIGAKASGLVDALATVSATRVPMWSELLDTALQLAVIGAVLVSKPSHGRRAAAIALLGGLLGERLFGQPGKLIVTALALFFTLRTAHQSTTRDALRLTAGFELVLALGRIAGRVVAGVLLGPLAIPLGEALGEQFTALSASSRLEPIEVAPRAAPAPLSPTTVRALMLSALGVAVVMILGPWRTWGRDAPWSWNEVSGKGWTAQMPGKPVRQTTITNLFRLRGQAPLHHYASVWKGSLFTVLELEWPAHSVEIDDSGLLTSHALLPFIHLQGCNGLFIGVTRENSVRCLTSAKEDRLVLGCVLSDPRGSSFVEGELAFLANLKAGDSTFEGDKLGLKHPEDCVLDPARLRESGRFLQK